MALKSCFESCILLDKLAIYKIWDIVFLHKTIKIISENNLTT